MNPGLRNLVAAAELVARTTVATFLSTWLISQKFDLRNVEYAGGAAAVSAAVSVLALLQNHETGPVLTPAPAPAKPPA